MTTNEPWVAFYDQPTFLPPGELARWQREEARIRGEDQRKEAERIDRADARQERAIWEARQHAVARGLPWDPAKPFEHWPSVYARADAMFAAQDAQARHMDFQAAKDAGLVHLLHQSPGQSPPPSGSGPGGPSLAGEATRANLRARIRGALDRWAHRSEGCAPGSVRSEDGSRPLDDGRLVIRSFSTEPRIVE